MLKTSIMSKNPLDIRVVVTGLGTVNPLGNTVKDYWDNLKAGKNGIRTIKNVEIDDYGIRIAGEVDPPDVSEYFKEKKMSRRLDRYVVYGYIAGTQALRDSGLDVSKAPERYGSLIGTGDGGVDSNLENVSRIVKTGMHSTSPFYIINSIPSTGSGFFAQSWDLRGPSFSVNSACATSNHSIGVASMMIKMGMADAIFAGGAEAPVNKSGLCAFGNIFALSDRNDSPETASRPFDVDRNGFVLGEGAGVLCLEELEHAKKRGAHIYCEVTGFGFSCDAHDLVAPHPEARGGVQAITAALDGAGVAPNDIDFINCHATSTPLGDIAEYRATRLVFGEDIEKVPVQSTKSMTGHLLGAAGGIEAIAMIMAFEEGVIHETTNQFNQDPEIKFNVIKGRPLEKRATHALSNGFGFGGQNAAVVLSGF
ncbi:MAG: beta-ketoacyl-[acyl-carrier-protein] synthase family protein, partial [Spirochaetales bacterium]|nr:beta-ketoacyl-[acyl-carrier-protein] synthase family protein [Spirochaetales bacterium]